MASRKNANASRVNEMPNTPPNRRMNVGHRMPNSNDSTVPLTAPTAKSTAKPLAQRRARSYQPRSPVRIQRPSA